MEPYIYPTLSPGHIRLLKIDPDSDPVSGTLSDVALENISALGLEYNALSYAWGEPGPTLDFICSGKILRVQENLFGFLQQAKTRFHEKLIWIDAICINQAEDTEKNHQIPQMDEAFGSVKVVKPSTLSPLPHESMRWDDFGPIFGRSWFNRLWVMQEVYASSHVIVIYGREAIEWDELVCFVDEVYKHRLDSNFGFSDSARDAYLGITCIMEIEALGKISPSPGSVPDSAEMTLLLHCIRERRVTNPIDKVYGSLALMPPSIQNSFTVDVSMSRAQLYAEFAKCLIEHGYGRSVLSQASRLMEVEDLPSWCPNFAEAPHLRPFDSLFVPVDFSAGCEVTLSAKEQIRLLRGSNMIELVGLDVGEVSETAGISETVVTDRQTAKAALEWDDACLKVADLSHDSSGGDHTLETFCGARIARGRMETSRTANRPLSEWVQDYKD